MTKVTDSEQGVTALDYDGRGFLTSITYPDSKGFSFEYDNSGRRTRRTGTDGYILNYGYDAAGRLETLTDGNNDLMVSYVYDATGRLERETKGNGTYTTYTYDAAGQVLEVTNYAPDDSVQSFFRYTYDAKGNRLTMTTQAGVTRYEYDALNQLVRVTYPNGRQVTYAYDAAGNRKTVTDSGDTVTYTANHLNQYTQAGPTSFGYDADGNQTRKTDTSGTTTYRYDVENRLVRVETPTDGIFEYTYDALGNRTTITHDGVATRYLHDPIGLVDVAAEYDNAGALVARYDHGLGLVARTDSDGNEAFYSFDALGNTRELTDGSGAVVNEYDYDAFGKLTSQSETTYSSFKQAGRYGVTEDECGLVFQINSEYDTDLGRQVSNGFTVDPFNLGRDLGKITRGWLGIENAYRSILANSVRNPFLAGLSLGKNIYGIVAGINNSMWAPQGDSFRMGGLFEDIGRLITAYSDNPLWAKHGKLTDMTIDLVSEWLSPKKGFQAFLSVLDYGEKAIQGVADVWDLSNRLLIASQVSTTVVRPRDPNDKIGPVGIGPNHVVSRDDEMEYIVRFENFATASAPVQELAVVDYLDPGLDWSTVKFKEMAYGGRIITIPEGSQTFAIQDTPPSDSPAVTGMAVAHMVVNATGSVNPQIGRVEWRLSSLDLRTNYFPIDALTGFLPPEDGTGCGQGYVKFSVKPKATTPYGTTVTNIATIVFDGNDPIDTPPVSNVIGDVPPLTTVIAYLPGVIEAGTPFSYTVALKNTGETTVSNLSLTDTLPVGSRFVSANATRGIVTITDGLLTWTLDEAAGGEEALLTITAVADVAGTFTNRISFSGGSGLAIFTSSSEFTVVPSTPRLAIRQTGNVVELSWPEAAGGWVLESSADLGLGAQWVALGAIPTSIGGRLVVSVPVELPRRFYRLTRTND